MADKIVSGPTNSCAGSGSGMNIHTRKIMDACRDKDCVEDLRVFPTISSQVVLDTAFSVRPVSASLLYADVNVDEISFNRGHYTVDVTYFYQITGESFPGGVPVKGLALFDKRVILYGSEGSVKTYTSEFDLSSGALPTSQMPVAVVDAVDPIALNLRIAEPNTVPTAERRSIPAQIIALIGEDINLGDTGKKLFVTLGQFTMIRLERDYQLSVAAQNYLPCKECVGSSDDDPCTLFSRVSFPVDEFYPPDTLPCEENYRDLV